MQENYIAASCISEFYYFVIVQIIIRDTGGGIDVSFEKKKKKIVLKFRVS